MVRRHRPSIVGLMKSTGLIKSEQAVPILVAITILYQLSYNVVMFGSLPDSEGSGECTAAGSSSYCQEIDVFRSWQGEDFSSLMERTEPEPIEQEHLDLIEFGRQVASENDPVDAIHDTTSNQNSASGLVSSSAETDRATLNETHIAAKLESHLSQLASTVDESAMSNTGVDHNHASDSTTSTPTQLHWSSVMAWSKASSSFLSSKAPSMVTRGQVRHLHWSGSIPKVACVTPIMGDRHAKARMMYFIDNFRLQDYDGARQLVLVYHYLDERAAKLTQSYADGTYIKAVAAQGNGSFPSTAALRFGAWSSDADVIANWDFDEWHDPSQLSMQIHAMALASKPACIIRGSAKSSSLVGEASWMRINWRPYQDKEAGAQALQQDGIVELDMKALSSETTFTSSPEDVKPSEEHRSASIKDQRDWNISGCIDLESSSKIDAISHNLDKTVTANMSDEMSKTFRKLVAKRHDITLKLQLLCLQNTSERDSKKHESNRKHVVQMLSVRGELDKHIAATAALFQPAIE